MKMMFGMFLVSHALGILVCAAAAALNACWGNRIMAAAFLFFTFVNVAGTYANYRSLKAHNRETAAKEEAQ